MKIAALEGLLFIVGEDGIDIKKVQEILEVSYEEAKEMIQELFTIYSSPKRGIQLYVLGNHLKLTTKKEHSLFYKKLVIEEESILSQAALETLAIVAYNQPITRVKIDEIRGISSGHMIRKLISKNLIREIGKSDEAGRPSLYGTTNDFLDYFGLPSINDLPVIEQKNKEISKSDLYHVRYNEEEY
jgi:segregation and condensation protein B